MTIRLLADSSCNIPPAYQESLGIIVVPAWVNFADGSSFRNGVDMTDAEFYRRLETEKKLPTTAQPTPQEFAEAVAALPEEEVIIGAVSSKLSGTYNSAVQAIKLVPDKKVHAYDTLSASMGAGWQIIAGAELAQQGADADAIIAEMKRVRQNSKTIFVIDTLKYLAASGRAPVLQALVGSLLSIKPLLEFQNGILELAGRVRGRKRSKRELLHRIVVWAQDRPLRVAVINANAVHEAELFAEDVRRHLNVKELQIVEIGPVLGTLAGPGTLAIAAYSLTD
ncbi:MAG: DegV family protein [Chloroflexi bacterium]|nr:DegV family protein [Chloroflexota bacterium]